jgi:MoxR-like ATPase
MSKLNSNQLAFVLTCEQKHGINALVTREEIQSIVDEQDVPFPYWLTSKQEYREGRGSYRVPVSGKTVVAAPELEPALVPSSNILRQPKLLDESEPAIPESYPDYVPFGFFKKMVKVIKSKKFFPVFITGLSGNGKTLMVEQVCFEEKRECVRVNISIETDESDLLGSMTLIDGNTVWRDGPVITAMKRGAILLIDEVDRGSNKLMCLQGIMEGKPYYNKKNGEMVKPKHGFNVVATANTKGMGSDEGRYLAQILDSAFLERFPITVEQEFPDAKTEKKILKSIIKDEEFIDNLVQWSDVIRKSFNEGAISEVISTRRLVHIAGAYDIFDDRMEAINLCVSRFDEETKMAFLDLYTKVDAKVDATPAPAAAVEDSKEIAF